MKCKKMKWNWLVALVMTVIVVSGNIPLIPVQAASTALDSYDSATDIGDLLLPSGKYTASSAYRNEMIFKAVNYHQSSYNMTVDAVYTDNKDTTEDSLRFIVAKAKDTYNKNAEVTIEVVVCGKDVHIFARQSNGTQTTIRDFFKSNGTKGETNSYAIRYSNRKLWFYENNQAVISGVNLANYSRFSDIEPYVGLAFLFSGGTYSNLRLWGKGIEFYGQFPSIPEGNGDYADYMGIKSIQGTTTEYKNGVLKNTQVSTDMVAFTKLPFTNQDTYAWSFEVNVEKAEKTYHGVRPIIRADEKFQNMYQLVITDGSVIVMYNSTEIESAYYDRTLGKTDKFGMVVEPDAVSVWVNDVLVLDRVSLEHDLPSNIGVKYEFAKSTMKNMSFYYTEPTKFVVPEADPTIPKMTSGMYNGALYMKVLDDNKEVHYENCTVSHVSGTGNKYNFTNIPMPEDADYTLRTSLTITKGLDKGYNGARILFRTSKQGDIYLAFCDNRVILLVGNGSELDSYPMKIAVGKAYDVAIYSTPDEVNVWIDGKLIFNREPLSKSGEKTIAKAGIWFEGCEAKLAKLQIYGKSIVLTDEIFDLELHNNPYFNATTVPKKPNGNINHFENVKLSDSKLQRRYADGVLQIPISSTYTNYLFKDQNNSYGLNGLKKSDTFVWHAKVKASQVANVEIEGAARQDAGVLFTFKQSDHPSASNVNYRMTFCMMDNRLELQIWQNSAKIKNYINSNFAFETDREYAIDILVGTSWVKVWVDQELIFTSYELPEYQLYFNVAAANVEAQVYDFNLYNVESNEDAEVLALANATKATLAGNTLESVEDQEIPLMDWNSKTIVVMIVSISFVLAAIAISILGVKEIRKHTKTKEMEGENI